MLLRILFILIISTSVHAELSVQGLPSASGLSFTFMETANTNVIRGKLIAPGSIFFNSQYGYINQPLIWRGNGMEKKLVSDLHTLDLRLGVLATERMNLSVNLSLNSITRPEMASKFLLGDSVAQMKYRVTDIYDKIQVALIPELYLPFGSQTNYLSTGEVGAAFKVAATRAYGRVKLAANVGFRYLPGATLQNLSYEKQAIAGIGSEILVTDRFSLNLEGIGFFSTPYKENNSTGEVYIGGLYAVSPTTVFSAGASRSGFSDTSNQSFRAIAGFKTYFAEPAARPTTKTKVVPAADGSSCFTEPLTSTFHSRPLTVEEQAKLHHKLPYIDGKTAHYKKSSVTIKTLRYGEMTGSIGMDFPIVKDGQTPFAIDLTDIPDYKNIKEINHAWLKMKVNKLSQDNFLGTELLCSLNFGVCSGSALEKDKWGALFNPEFFNGKKRIFNDRFGRLYLNKPIKEVDGVKLYSKMLTFPLRDLAMGSHIDARHFFQNAKKGKKTLYFVVADDTFLSNEVSLEVSLGVQRCYRKR